MERQCIYTAYTKQFHHEYSHYIIVSLTAALSALDRDLVFQTISKKNVCSITQLHPINVDTGPTGEILSQQKQNPGS